MTRINTSVKGRNHELEDAKHCNTLGYKICCRSIRTRWQRIDYANIFDIVANMPRSDGVPHNYFISSKSNGHYSKQHIEELTAWTFERAQGTDIVELRDHHDGEWKFSRVDCNHRAGCKAKDRVWKKCPAKKTCASCGRKLKVVRQFKQPFIRVSGFNTKGISTWTEKVNL